MTKQLINIGETANDRKGDSLRAAFTKINDNFTDLYTALGLNADVNLNLGAFEFAGSVMTTTDSTPIVIDQSVTVSSDLTVGGDIVPSVANGGNLGSLARPFRSLYVSTNTVFLGGVPLSLEAGTNELTINNVPISQTINFTDITGQLGLYKPDSITDYRSGSYYNSIAVPAGSVIIDHATYRWATDSGLSSYRDTVFQPSVYSATINQSGNITDIQITTARSYPNPNSYPDFINYEIVNTDNMVAIDSGIDITDPVAIAASSMFEILLAGVTSIAKPIPTDISELEDIGGLLGGGNANTGNFTFNADTIANNNDASIAVGGGLPIENVEVAEIDELVPPGGIWRLFIDEGEYPTLGTTVQIGDTVTTSWGTPITATITDIVQDSGDWQIHVEQDITAGFNGYDTVTFSTVVTTKTWRFGTDGALTLPAGGDILDSNGDSVLGGGSYTPDDSDNWDSPTVNTVTAALDELAARVTALENFEIDGGNAYTPAAGELIIDGNGA